LSPSPPPNRLIVPSAAVLAGALALSLLAHVQAYDGLGDLRAWLASSAQDSMPSSTIEITLGDPPETPTPHDELDPVAEVPTPVQDRPRTHERTHERPRERPPERPHPVVATPPPTPPPPAPTEPAPPRPPAPPPPDHTRPSVAQHSQSPDQPPPENAAYQADENNTVAEETMAQITSATHDDAIPSPGPPEEAATEDTPGESSETVVADMRDTEGTHERRPTPDEAEQQDAPDATDDPAHSQRPTSARTGTDGSDAPDREVEHGTPSPGDESGVLALGGRETQEVMISDGFGSYSVRVVAPGAAGDGGGTRGGHRRDGTGLGSRGHGVYVGSAGAEGGSPHDHGVGERDGPRVGITYATAEAVYGEEQLEHERHMRLERRRSHARGSTSAAIWEHFRAASENYIAGVRPGNQTALNAAASPFARFLHDMHVRIHQEFAEHYLSTLSLDPADPLNDETLYTALEIAVNPDGTIYRVGIIRTSGQTLFDLGAFTAVWRAQPFPHPPTIIMSGDGHAWLHWRFDRGPNHCGTWNAEPFLLDNGDAPPQTTTDVVSDHDLAGDDEEPGSPIEMVPAAPIGTPGQ
jgi:hypothetical protein